MFACLILFPPNKGRIIAVTWIAAIALNFVVNFDVSRNFYINFFFGLFHLEFLLGRLTAHLSLRSHRLPGIALFLIGAICFVFFASLVGVSGDLMSKGHWGATTSLGLTAAVMVLGASRIDWQPKDRITKMVCYIWDASYSVYLIHFYVIISVFKFKSNLPISGFFLTTISVIFATVAGVVLYRVVEMPILQFLRRKLLSRPSQINVVAVNSTPAWALLH